MTDMVADLLANFNDLVEKDAQVKYALNAIRRYKTSELIDADDERKSRHKRNIITVDDNLKINYEMVKIAPGTFIESSVAASKNKTTKEKAGKVSKMKTNYYKKRLYNMNELFLADQVSSESTPTPTPTAHVAREAANKEPPSEQQQLQWLREVHLDLLQEYRSLLQEEKKWFLKKELMLDANVKLDLYSMRDDEQDGLLISNKVHNEMCSFPA
ncbi:LADA_0A06304g1_1 [Lachancea dasiensis]|uniref:LADA_0A06304g1_1 n=1 Tax=Lachancea dasiensis TaxID=1072105 RepID=A0A1G4IPV0_9SACH|nr:LADA_0A06304g1_1 [Lachancea dasiensis]